ncbi:MAG: RHS repeat-associated core domain-containing protein [Sedimentisphaerales bacterium]|nr:RHS repeat-associated core domain-containing protein [Sedimentisphaerales bacterium]
MAMGVRMGIAIVFALIMLVISVWAEAPGDYPDFDGDNYIDIYDLEVLAGCWLQDCNEVDIAPEGGDGIIDLLDFSTLSQYWLSFQFSDTEFPYLTSFEESQGFEVDETLQTDDPNEVDGWEIDSEGEACIAEATYYYDETQEAAYQYLNIEPGSTVSRSFEEFFDINHIIRINCIPARDSYIHLKNGQDTVASLYFDTDHYIHVWDEGAYEETLVDCNEIAAPCLAYLANTNPDMEGYSYENTWIEFEIQLDWTGQSYDIFWRHWDEPEGAMLVTGVSFDDEYHSFTDIEFIRQTGDEDFKLNRVSVSDFTDGGGVLGEDEDIWITHPKSEDIDYLQGACEIVGKVWFDQLGEYQLRCCPTNLDTSDPDNWMLVNRSGSPRTDTLLGYWYTEKFYNGDYFLKLEVYNDLGLLHDDYVRTKNIYFNGGSKEVSLKHPIIGKGKGRTYHYEAPADITINWPGSFPFEFRRTYDDALGKCLYPLFFGWTHNHNIRLTEDCTSDWQVDEEDKPLGDGNGLGIGRLWLQQALSTQLYIGHKMAEDPNKVIYISRENQHIPLDKQRDYIIREAEIIDPCNVELTYTYHIPDGRTMTFDPNLVLTYNLPADPETDEGVVDWMAAKGIQCQQDRFGNGLVYTWEDDLLLQKITTSTGADDPIELRFVNNGFPDIFGPDGPNLISKIQWTVDGQTEEDIIRFDVTPSVFYPDGLKYRTEKYTTPQTYNPEYIGVIARFDYDIEDELGLVLKKSEPFYLYYKTEAFLLEPYTIKRNKKDGSLIEYIDIHSANGFELSWQYDLYKTKYSYDYDDAGNLQTTISHIVDYDLSANNQVIREEEVISNPKGAILSQKVNTYKQFYNSQELDPYNYQEMEINPWSRFRQEHYLCNYRFYSGGGGNCDIEYLYNDPRHPLKPTIILTYCDDDGDSINDGPARKTTLSYDDYGNVLEERVYSDPNNYVLTCYQYHQKYNFPVSQKTWQGLCFDSAGGAPVTSGVCVEKLWYYSDKDGSELDWDGNTDVDWDYGDFLVQERDRIKELDIEDPNLFDPYGPDYWRTTSYTYNINGRVITQTDPVNNIICISYDNNGFPQRQWQGAALDGQGQPIGQSQKRYYYNTNGMKILEANELGKVSMYVKDQYGRVLQDRTYYDYQALDSAVDFVPDRYDDDIESDPPCDDDTWQSRIQYFDYDMYNRHIKMILPFSGIICKAYQNEKAIILYNLFDNPSPDTNEQTKFNFYTANDGRILFLEKEFYNIELPNVFYLSGYKLINIYDSMDRIAHTYELNYYKDIMGYYPHPFLKHTEYGYTGTGKKSYEKVYKVRRLNNEPSNPEFSQVLERRTCYYYDGLDRLIEQIEDPCDLAITTSYGYDALGNQVYVVDPKGQILITDYDILNRKVREYFAAEPVVDPISGEIDLESSRENAQAREEYTYYRNDKIKSITSYDYDGSILAYKVYTYDSRNRLSSVTEDIDASSTALTQYEYYDTGTTLPSDPCDPNLYHINIIDAENKSTWIALTPEGKPKKKVYPCGRSQDLIYNGNGQVEKKIVWDENDNPFEIRYTYDEFGKVEEVIYPDDGKLVYSYGDRSEGKFGKVVKIVDTRYDPNVPGDPNEIYTFKYCPVTKQLVTCTDGQGYTVTYQYNTAYKRANTIEVWDPNSVSVYAVEYAYDLAGRLTGVIEGLTEDLIAGLDYDMNSNLDQLTYYLEGTEAGSTGVVDYDYNDDNVLSGYTTTGGPTFSLSNVTLDGLGRLVSGDEQLTKVDDSTVSHSMDFGYDMLSELTDATVTGIGGGNWAGIYSYSKDGNIDWRKINSDPCDTYTYDGNIMTQAEGTALTWDENGNMTDGIDTDISYDWDNRLSSATSGSNSISVRYDPFGNRVRRQSDDGSTTITRKYIVGNIGGLPGILLELDPNTGDSIEKTYIYANNQIICQYDGDTSGDKYFYLADRLGSVREVIDENADVKHLYTYDPFGNMIESDSDEDDIENAFRFTGQYYDEGIGQYYLRARQYDPWIARFTGIDPVQGNHQEPLTLHAYLYCLNNPINRVDPSGNQAAEPIEPAAGLAGRLAAPALAYAAGYSAILNSMITDINTKRFYDISFVKAAVLGVMAFVDTYGTMDIVNNINDLGVRHFMGATSGYVLDAVNQFIENPEPGYLLPKDPYDTSGMQHYLAPTQTFNLGIFSNMAIVTYQTKGPHRGQFSHWEQIDELGHYIYSENFEDLDLFDH